MYSNSRNHAYRSKTNVGMADGTATCPSPSLAPTIATIDLGNLTNINDLQSQNALNPMRSSPSTMSTFSNDAQSRKTSYPIERTDFGTFISDNDAHPRNA